MKRLTIVLLLVGGALFAQLPPGHPASYGMTTMLDLTPQERFWFTAGAASAAIYWGGALGDPQFEMHLKTAMQGAYYGDVSTMFSGTLQMINSNFKLYSQASFIACFYHYLGLQADLTYKSRAWPNPAWPELETRGQYTGRSK